MDDALGDLSETQRRLVLLMRQTTDEVITNYLSDPKTNPYPDNWPTEEMPPIPPTGEPLDDPA